MAIYIDPTINLSQFKYVFDTTPNSIIFSNIKTLNVSSGDVLRFQVYEQFFNPPYFITYYKTIPGPFYQTNSQFSASSNNQSSNSITDRADFPFIFICGFVLIFVIIFIINQLTKLVKKGGIFGFM